MMTVYAVMETDRETMRGYMVGLYSSLEKAKDKLNDMLNKWREEWGEGGFFDLEVADYDKFDALDRKCVDRVEGTDVWRYESVTDATIYCWIRAIKVE